MLNDGSVQSGELFSFMLIVLQVQRGEGRREKEKGRGGGGDILLTFPFSHPPQKGTRQIMRGPRRLK
jgi:hypothetical protein